MAVVGSVSRPKGERANVAEGRGFADFSGQLRSPRLQWRSADSGYRPGINLLVKPTRAATCRVHKSRDLLTGFPLENRGILRERANAVRHSLRQRKREQNSGVFGR